MDVHPAQIQWRAGLMRLLEMSESELAEVDIAEVNLAMAVGLPTDEHLYVPALLQKLDEWAELVRINTEHWWPRFEENRAEYDNSPAKFRILSMVTVLQRDLGVRYNLAFSEGEYDASDSRNLFLHGVLTGHGGTCVTMPVLYIAIGRRLGYPLELVGAKEHLFVRWEEPGGERFNIECTSPGFEPRDDEYYHRYPRPLSDKELASGMFLRNFTPREQLAVFLKERAQCCMDNFQLAEGVEAYHYADRLAPKLPGGMFAYAAATILAQTIYAAQQQAAREGHYELTFDRLVWPPITEDWHRWALPEAKDNLARIIRVARARKQGRQSGQSAEPQETTSSTAILHLKETDNV